MKKIFIIVLSWLLHHANRNIGRSNKNCFYPIKNKILAKYGKYIKYDVQYIAGLRCYSCGGTGVHHHIYDNYGFISDSVDCWNCNGTGWYKLPVWNILSKIKLGKYCFHQPYQRCYVLPEIVNKNEIIDGYITHDKSKYGNFCLFVLFFMYEKKYLKRWYKETGNYYSFKFTISNIIYIIKHKTIPRKNKPNKPRIYEPNMNNLNTDELPF
jgi:hypothetical protein